jgi:hypothetical protein
MNGSLVRLPLCNRDTFLAHRSHDLKVNLDGSLEIELLRASCLCL